MVNHWNIDTHADIFERLASIRLRAELNRATGLERNYWSSDMQDLMGLTSPFFIATELDYDCLHLENRFARFAACAAAAREFPGRCEGLKLAVAASPEVSTEIVGDLNRCGQRKCLEWLRSNHWPLPSSDSERDPTPERHRLAMRLYASASNPVLRNAACKAAATMPESRDIPECTK